MIKLGRNDVCWCGSGMKYKKCHYNFDSKLEQAEREGHEVPGHDLIKTPEQIEGIKKSAAINIAVLDYVGEHIRAGITTEEIDKWVYDETVKRGGIPAPLNYEGFPKSVCTSLNDEVCHGIPSKDIVLKDEILLMSTAPRFWTDIFQIHPVCILSGTFPRRRRNWYRLQKSAWM